MIKFLHLADLHLDSPFTSTDATLAKQFMSAQRETFTAALDFAEREDVKIVLLSGDLFDTEYHSKETVQFLHDSFSTHSRMKFVITPGNHDPYNAESYYYKFPFTSNVHIFKKEKIDYVRFDELKTTVYGYAFVGESYHTRPLSNFTVPNDGNFTILVAHGDTTSPNSLYAPITREDIARSGFDYIALGHIHTKPEIQKEGRTYYAYSGCLFGRDFSEHGEKGGILVSYDENEKKISVARHTFCDWAFYNKTVDITTTRSQKEASELVLTALNTDTVRTSYTRLTLIGVTPYSFDEEKLSALLSGRNVTIKNKSICLSSFSELESDFSIKGEFYRNLKPYLLGNDDDLRSRAFKALCLGISALDGASFQNLL